MKVEVTKTGEAEFKPITLTIIVTLETPKDLVELEEDAWTLTNDLTLTNHNGNPYNDVSQNILETIYEQLKPSVKGN